VSIDDRLIELDYGQWEGRPFAAVTAEEWRRWRADPAWSPPGGESLADVGARVRAALADLAAEAARADIVVVSHVSPIKAAVAWALGMGDELAWAVHLDPASLTRIAIRTAGPVVHSLNERLHAVGE
jgi:broad specificity phosphatase PhoE